MSTAHIGFLHPGAMGVSLAASAIASGNVACWVAQGRSEQTHGRAREHGLAELPDLGAMGQRCAIIVSICPPAAAGEVLDGVVSAGFSGLYVDANAISPMTANALADRARGAGIDYVDGSVIGGPAWVQDETCLYLSGARAQEVAACFEGGPLATRVIGDAVDRASALKMCYAAYSKGAMALLCAIVGAAEELGVRDELEHQWALDEEGFVERTHARMSRVTAKAWRYVGEMREIAKTLEHAGMPGGFHGAAADVYERLAPLKGRDPAPALGEVLGVLGGRAGIVDREASGDL